MKIIRIILFSFLSFIFLSSARLNDKVGQEKKVIDPVTIDIIPYNDIPEAQVKFVYTELLKIYPKVELKKSIPLPKSAFYIPRQRYRADSLINDLSKQTHEGHVSIGLTAKDISTTKDKYPDWGIMGLGFCPGKACIASTFRLDKKNVPEQLFKVAIHELGHTQGLDHCVNKTCFMQDAEGKNTTNNEKEFCPKCKAVLISKGWKFN